MTIRLWITERELTVLVSIVQSTKGFPSTFTTSETMGLDRGRVVIAYQRLEENGYIKRETRLWATGELLPKAYAALQGKVTIRGYGKSRRTPYHGKGTRFSAQIRPSSTDMLKFASNPKLGRIVRKGYLRGAHIYTLTLTERTTCPRSCELWTRCYGNNMGRAYRYELDENFYRYMEFQLEIICNGPRKILVRLHTLGDFNSIGYVWFWRDMLLKYDNLYLFGYTAWPKNSLIGAQIDALTNQFGWRRSAFRFSGGKMALHTADLIVDNNKAIPCPHEDNLVKDCGSCGLCWNSERSIGWKEH